MVWPIWSIKIAKNAINDKICEYFQRPIKWADSKWKCYLTKCLLRKNYIMHTVLYSIIQLICGDFLSLFLVTSERGSALQPLRFCNWFGPLPGPWPPLCNTHPKKIVEKSLTFLKKRKFSKTWQDPIYRQNSVYYILYIWALTRALTPSM